MSDMTLPFFVGTVENFEECGINTLTERKSLDGNKVIVHMHNLTMEQFNVIRTKMNILALTYNQTLELMQTPEWVEVDV